MSNTREIPLTNSDLVATVDADDYERVMAAGPWAYLPNAGRARAVPDSASVAAKGLIRLHRLVMGFGPGDPTVDHVNGNILDNRKANLRPATPKENAANTGVGSNNTSGFKGVSFNKKSGRWLGTVQRVYKTDHGTRVSVHLLHALCATAEEAAHAVDAFNRARTDVEQRFITFNFPQGDERPARAPLATPAN